MLVYLVLVIAMGFFFMHMPTSFLPEEDQGVLMVQVQLPTGATQESSLKVMEKVTSYFYREHAAAVQSVFSLTGFNFAGRGQNLGMALREVEGLGRT